MIAVPENDEVGRPFWVIITYFIQRQTNLNITA